MVNLPAGVTYGTVTGQYVVGKSDSNDSGLQPDMEYASGTLTFTAAPSALLDTADLLTIVPGSVTATLNALGQIVGADGSVGLRLIATDNVNVNPVAWTWKVRFNLTDATGSKLAIAPFSFDLPAGEIVDLASATPLADSTGTNYIRGIQGETGPQGLQGPQGETGAGISTGGVIGQVLTKASSTNFDTAWAYNIPIFMPFASGSYYRPWVGAATGVALGTGSLYFMPLIVTAPSTLDQIAVTPSTVTTAGTVRMGIYADSSNSPGALLVDSGSVNYTTSNTPATASISQALSPGRYWLAAVVQTGSSTWLGTSPTASSYLAPTQKMGALTSSAFASGYLISGVTGALPSTGAGATTANAGLIAYVRAA